MIYLNDDIAGFDFDAALPLLSEQRREQALKFKYVLGRKTCAMAYLLLCEGLQKEYGLTERPVFEYGEHGKPAIIGHTDIHFNLSHCREAVICAVSDKPVGIDIESPRTPRPSLINYTMNADEAERIRQAPDPSLLFTQLWTMKEALVKLTATGITDNLRDVLRRDDVSFHTIFTPRYLYTICQYKE